MDDKIREAIIAEIKKYLQENVEDFEHKADRAWDKIDKYRAPLSHIDPEFDEEIMDMASEWFAEEFQDSEDFI